MGRIEKEKNVKRLSSILTFVYKIILPILLLGILILLNFVLKGKATKEDLLGINISYLIIMTIGYLPISNIKEVYFDSKKLYYSNYFIKKESELNSIIKVKRWMFFFFRIFIENEGNIKKMKFLPREFGSLHYLFNKSESIIELERLIKKSK